MVNVNNNTFTGASAFFPPVIYELTALETLDIVRFGIQGSLNGGDMLKLNKLRRLNLAENQITGGMPQGDGWLQWTQIEVIELQGNRITSSIPKQWSHLKTLRYVNLSRNIFTGPIPIFTEAQRLEGLEFSENNLSVFPWAYFDPNSFPLLEYINVNFNPEIVVPEQCFRYAFCFKKTLIQNDQGNDWHKVPDDTRDLIRRSTDTMEYPYLLP